MTDRNLSRWAETQTGNHRRGITLLEVLISMFVALVGLCGLASLFWLGGVEMSEGVKLDRAVNVARSAQRTFKILGLHRPIQIYNTTGGSTTSGLAQMWLTPAGATVDGSGTPTGAGATAVQPVMPFSTTSFGSGTSPCVAYGYYSQGFAIDPIGVLANATSGANSATAYPAYDTAGQPITYTAPSTANPGVPNTSTAPNPIPCLSRITLQAYPQASTTQVFPQTGLTALSAGQADLIFRSQDDLLLNPAAGDYPPTQAFSSGLTGRRQSQGDYSWMATVVPSFATYKIDGTTTPTTYTPIGDNNLMRVSTVVYYKRVPLVSAGDGTTPPSERMVTVATGPTTTAPIGPDATISTALPTGVAGGDIQLQGTTQIYLNLKPGQWIMLSQASATPALGFNVGGVGANASITMGTTYWSRWYKVVATGPVVQNSSGSGLAWYRNVSLLGPDWNPNPNTTAMPTYASIFDGVVAVYEKEIEFEQSGSPWSSN